MTNIKEMAEGVGLARDQCKCGMFLINMKHARTSLRKQNHESCPTGVKRYDSEQMALHEIQIVLC